VARLGACLESLKEELQDGSFDLVAVDNASPDESAAVFKSVFPDRTLLASDQNRGFAGGCNLAWSSVQGRYWLLLNPDTVLPTGILRQMVAWLDARPRVGVASPHITGPDGKQSGAARRFPSLSLSLLELSRLHLLLPPGLRGRLFLGPYRRATAETTADWVPGTAMFIRTDAARKVGLLSEAFFMYGEDIEYCWRVKRLGWQVMVPDRLTIEHAERSSSDATWGAGEAQRRSLQGWYRACAAIKGERYATTLKAVDWLAHSVAARTPWAGIGTRRASREAADVLRQLLLDR
jgi:hypothetical protein